MAIASVLAAGPECLILDEPTAGLDAAYRRRILCLLSDLRRRGRTVITITHDLEMAFGCCDRLLVMDSGRTVGEGGVGTALPSLMQALSSPVWPEVLQVSDRLRAHCSGIPLTWDPRRAASGDRDGDRTLRRRFDFDPLTWIRSL